MARQVLLGTHTTCYIWPSWESPVSKNLPCLSGPAPCRTWYKFYGGTGKATYSRNTILLEFIIGFPLCSSLSPASPRLDPPPRPAPRPSIRCRRHHQRLLLLSLESSSSSSTTTAATAAHDHNNDRLSHMPMSDYLRAVGRRESMRTPVSSRVLGGGRRPSRIGGWG